MFQKKLIHVGTFGKPVGLKGEIKLLLFTSNIKSFAKKNVLLQEDGMTKWNFDFLRESKGRAIIKIKERDTRESVELLNGKKIFVERKNFSKTKKDEYYIVDLINCEVIAEDKKKLGFVQSIENFGASDLINVQSLKGDNFFITMKKNNIVSVDLKAKKIIVSNIKGMID